MQRFHIALSVSNVHKSVKEYTKRLGQQTVLVIENEYALWKTNGLNVSVRVDPKSTEKLRHLGWEVPSASHFSAEEDINGITWEEFQSDQQVQEILDTWKQVQPSELPVIHEANTTDRIQQCFDLMHELRPHLQQDSFTKRVLSQQKKGI